MSRREGRKKESPYVRLTGMWKPTKKGKKQLCQGVVKLEALEELIDKTEAKGGDGVFLYLFKNEFAESSSDPGYVLTGLPLDDEEDDDDSPRRRRSKTKKSRAKPRRQEEDDDDDDDGFEDADDDDDEVPF